MLLQQFRQRTCPGGGADDNEKFSIDESHNGGGHSPQGIQWGRLCGPYSSAQTSQRELGLRVIIVETQSRMAELSGGKEDH